MINSNKIVIIFISLVIFGCTVKETVEIKGLNGNGVANVWIYKQRDAIVRTEFDDNEDGVVDRKMFWSTDGRLVSTESRIERSGKTKTDYHYFHKAISFKTDGESIWRNQLDINKTYSKDMRSSVGAFFMYTQNDVPIFAEMDSDNDGRIDRTIYYENYTIAKNPSKELTDRVRKIQLDIRNS